MGYRLTCGQILTGIHSTYLMAVGCWGLGTTEAADLYSAENPLLHSQQMSEGLNLFKETVRPTLLQNCFECHGGESIEGDLDLSSRESLVKSGVILGSSDKSVLSDVINHRGELFMPKDADQLSAGQIAAIERWIQLGAPYDRPLSEGFESSKRSIKTISDDDRDYWAYTPLHKPALPLTNEASWAINEIDRFVLARMQSANIEPSEQASERTLLRRAYLNAIGLPPTFEQVIRFMSDFEPGAYERAVDDLLQSKHYGERWARHWMDIARFAESSGFEIDFDRPYAYHYRDFLIKAFNSNMPYDQFVQWQVAGDQLDPQNPLAWMATGFLGAGAFPSVLTEREFESARYDELDDMINTLSTAMLGTTIACARCHDHKHDPFTTEDYYSLASVFTRTVRTYVDVDTIQPKDPPSDDSASVRLNILGKQWQQYEDSVVNEAFEAWLAAGDFGIPLERWLVLKPTETTSLDESVLEVLWDDSVLVSGNNPERENSNLIFEFETGLQGMTGLRMETLTHPSLPNNGPGRDHEGGFTISELSVFVQENSFRKSVWRKVELESAEATSQENQTSLSAGAAINSVSQGWSIDLDGFGKDQALVIKFKEPIGFAAGTRIRVTVASGYNLQQMVGRPRFSVTLDPRVPLVVSEGIPALAYEGMLQLLVGRSVDDLDVAERNALRRWFARKDAGWLDLRDRFIVQHSSLPLKTKTKILASSEGLPPVWHRSAQKGFPSFYEDTYHLERGDVDQKGPPASFAFPEVFRRGDESFMRDGRSPRESLAKWLVDVEYGAGSLLARVFVNRVWHYHFGRGLVATPSDFGTHGTEPSHPELLEWLAYDFVEHGWDIKRLQKQIMTSALYRQSSVWDKPPALIDPDNVLLWHFPSRRAEAEVIRDSMLSVSGLLDPAMFGPGSRDPAMNRRSVYFFIKRAALIPDLTLFDWPEHLISIGQRSHTTVAPQALQFLNSPQTRRYAEGLAQRVASISEPRERIRHLYQIVLARLPMNNELEWGIQFVSQQMGSYLENGDDGNLAWVDYCQSLFSLNEFLYIR